MYKSGFDLIAPVYDFLASLVFGRAMQESQVIYLNYIPAKADILIIGGGTGWLLPEILARTGSSRILYLEASAKMLHLAQQKVRNNPLVVNVAFRLGTEKNIKPTEKFDVIISHFVLDLFLPAELESFTRTLYQSLRPGGYWLVTDFVPATGSVAKKRWAQLLIRSMYLFFKVVSNVSASTLPDWQNMLRRYNLTRQQSDYFYHSLIKAVLYQKL